MKIALSIPGYPNIDTGNPQLTPLPSGVPTGGLFDSQGKIGGTGANIISTFFTLLIIVAILFALWSFAKGALDLIQSRGLKEKVQSGRERILYGIFGLIMVFLSFFFINAISAFFGNNLLPFGPFSSLWSK